jgi:hypothetical protein
MVFKAETEPNLWALFSLSVSEVKKKKNDKKE